MVQGRAAAVRTPLLYTSFGCDEAKGHTRSEYALVLFVFVFRKKHLLNFTRIRATNLNRCRYLLFHANKEEVIRRQASRAQRGPQSSR
jgi:hypothetical protein